MKPKNGRRKPHHLPSGGSINRDLGLEISRELYPQFIISNGDEDETTFNFAK